MSFRLRIAKLLDPKADERMAALKAELDSMTKAVHEHMQAADDWAAKADELKADLLAARGASFLGRRDEEVTSPEVELAVSAMASLDQWKAFVGGFVDRREQWVADTRQPVVYQNHAELASVNARIAECDHWLSIFEEVSRKVHGPTDDTP
jgi:hypothetical protein